MHPKIRKQLKVKQLPQSVVAYVATKQQPLKRLPKLKRLRHLKPNK